MTDAEFGWMDRLYYYESVERDYRYWQVVLDTSGISQERYLELRKEYREAWRDGLT